MRPEEMIFAVVMSVLFGGLFIVFVRMILNFFSDKRRKGSSLGAGELEAMIQHAVEVGNATLHDRLDHLEERIDQLNDQTRGQVKDLLEAQHTFSKMLEPGMPVEEHEPQRQLR